ncbi:TPA: type IV secretion system protein VirB3 [Vibrio parahaemolyticus]
MSEPIFKACTRPAMLFSVPMTPLIVSSLLIVFVGIWVNYFGYGMWTLLLLPVNYFVMRAVTKYDDNMFTLLWLKFKCRRTNTNRTFYNAAVYSPISFKKRD